MRRGIPKSSVSSVSSTILETPEKGRRKLANVRRALPPPDAPAIVDYALVVKNASGMEEAAKASQKVVRTGRAFEHGEAAYGARNLKPGFARAPENDLLFALGWPHARYLIEDHPDDRSTTPAAVEKAVFKPQVGLGVARGIAMRRIRAFSSFANGLDGKPRPGVLRALQNSDPMTEAEAKTFVLEHLAGRSLGTKQLEIVYLLEAVAGPDVVAEAITTAFETSADAQLLTHGADRSLWAFALGFILLRTSASVSVALRERLEARMARCSKDDVNLHSVANVLDEVLHQSKASLRSEHTEQNLLLHWVDEPAESIVRELTSTRRPWCGSVYARMVFVGGEAVIDYYARQYDKVKDAAQQRAIVSELGLIASPKIDELISAMSEKSRAEKEARAWCDENRRYYR